MLSMSTSTPSRLKSMESIYNPYGNMELPFQTYSSTGIMLRKFNFPKGELYTMPRSLNGSTWCTITYIPLMEYHSTLICFGWSGSTGLTSLQQKQINYVLNYLNLKVVQEVLTCPLKTYGENMIVIWSIQILKLQNYT